MYKHTKTGLTGVVFERLMSGGSTLGREMREVCTRSLWSMKSNEIRLNRLLFT